MDGRRIVLVAGFLTMVVVAPALLAEGAPQVTSEMACTQDSDCPNHPDCWVDWWPGCGCDEGRGRCDRNPKPCGVDDDCFRREVCSSESRCAEPGPGQRGDACNDDNHCPDWTLCLQGEDADCAGCELCSSANACVSLCQEDESCRLVLSGERLSPLFVSACVDQDRGCSTRLDCGGKPCLGGRCVDLQRFLERLKGESK